jgi:hypothetical protein
MRSLSRFGAVRARNLSIAKNRIPRRCRNPADSLIGMRLGEDLGAREQPKLKEGLLNM